MRRSLLALLAFLMVVGVTAQHDHGGHGDEEPYFDSGSSSSGADWLQTNDSFEFTFDAGAGQFGYHCHPHPTMVGTITVEGASDAHAMDDGSMDGMGTVHTVRIVDSAQGLAFEDWGYEPAQLTIQLGDTVRWTNDGETPHTVTATDAAPDHHDHEAPAVATVLAFGAVALLAAASRR